MEKNKTAQHCIDSKPPAATAISQPSTVTSSLAEPDVHTHLSKSSHAKKLQCCCARRWRTEEPPAKTGSGLERQITLSIVDSEQIQDLEDILNDWGSSFHYIQASAAFVKAAKIAQNRPKRAEHVCSKLVPSWHRLYSGSDEHGLANVVWASKLHVNDPKLWRETLESFTPRAKHATLQNLSNVVYALALHASRSKGSVPGLFGNELQQAVTSILEHVYVKIMHPMLEGVSAQHIANIWVVGLRQVGLCCRHNHTVTLVRALVRPQIVESADSQIWSNSMYGLSLLVQVCDLQASIDRRTVERLFSSNVMKMVADGMPQHVANTLAALDRLSNGHQPLVTRALAQQCAIPLLQGKVAANLAAWKSQDFADCLLACARLQMTPKPFLDAVVHAKEQWLPRATSGELKQVAQAFSTMDVHDLQLMHMIVECSQRRLKQSRASTQADVITGLAAVVSWSIARLDMQALAAEAVALVKSPVVMQQMQSKLSNDDASMLWQVHTWLLEHALLDGKGLNSCLTSDQLGVGKRVYERFLANGDDSRVS